MRRYISALIAVIFIVSLVSGCTSAPDSVVPPAAGETPAVVGDTPAPPTPTPTPDDTTPVPTPDTVTPTPDAPTVTPEPTPDTVTPTPDAPTPTPDDTTPAAGDTPAPPTPTPTPDDTTSTPEPPEPDPTPTATPTPTVNSGAISSEPIRVTTTPTPAAAKTATPAPAKVKNPRPAFTIPVPDQPGKLVESNNKAVVDYSNMSDGYVSVKYTAQTSNALRVRITAPGGAQYVYSLRSDGSYEIYPLSEGSGTYTVETLEQVPGGTGFTRALPTVTLNVKLTDEFRPFLRPSQYVNYSKSSDAVKKAAELTEYSQGLIEEITEVYNFVISNVVYDKELAKTVKTGYLPSVDKTLSTKKGICFDYAALMTAMLRSQGIPCKLAIGYAGTVYHAWISVWSKETGWINGVISFNGNTWALMDPTFAAGKNEYTGDGTKYDTRYIY